MARPTNKILNYRETLTRLNIAFTNDMNEDELKALVDKAMGKDDAQPQSAAQDDPADTVELSDDAVSKQLEAIVAQKVKALEVQLADMKKALSAATAGTATLTPDLVREIGLLAKDEVKDGLVNPDFIKPEDELPEVRTYYRVGPTWNMWHEEKAGVKVPLPYGHKNIKFEQAMGWVTRNGTSLEQRRISIFQTKNRKLAEAVERRADFGIAIHLNSEEALNTSVTGEFMELYKSTTTPFSRTPCTSSRRWRRRRGSQLVLERPTTSTACRSQSGWRWRRRGAASSSSRPRCASSRSTRPCWRTPDP